MKKIVIILTLLSYLSSFSQDKKNVYADEDLNIITKEEFDQNFLNKYFFIYKSKTDTSNVIVKVYRQKAGRISKEVHQKIKEQLYEISNIKISSSETIIINYFPSKDKCQGKDNWNSFFLNKCENYVNNINKKENVTQFFIFKNKNAVRNFGKKFKWYKDENQLIENTFFKFKYPCFSYVIIRPNGNYHSERGEYNISLIPNKIN